MYKKFNISKKLFSKHLACLLLTVFMILSLAYNAIAVPYTIVSSYNQVRDRYSNTIFPNVKIYTAETLDLSKLTIDYWLVVDQDYDDYEVFYSDYCHINGPYENRNITSKVYATVQDVTRPDPSGAPAKTTHMVTIRFGADAGYIQAGSTLELKCRIATPDWSINDQYNDPSFNRTATYYTSEDDVLVYYDNTPLNW